MKHAQFRSECGHYRRASFLTVLHWSPHQELLRMLLYYLLGEPVVQFVLLRPLSTRAPKDCREYTEPTNPHTSWYCFNSMRAAMMWVQGICCLSWMWQLHPFAQFLKSTLNFFPTVPSHCSTHGFHCHDHQHHNDKPSHWSEIECGFSISSYLLNAPRYANSRCNNSGYFHSYLPSQQFIAPYLHTIEVSIASTFKGIIGYLELLARENSLPENVASEVLIWIVPVFLITNVL